MLSYPIYPLLAIPFSLCIMIFTGGYGMHFLYNLYLYKKHIVNSEDTTDELKFAKMGKIGGYNRWVIWVVLVLSILPLILMIGTMAMNISRSIDADNNRKVLLMKEKSRDLTSVQSNLNSFYVSQGRFGKWEYMLPPSGYIKDVVDIDPNVEDSTGSASFLVNDTVCATIIIKNNGNILINGLKTKDVPSVCEEFYDSPGLEKLKNGGSILGGFDASIN